MQAAVHHRPRTATVTSHWADRLAPLRRWGAEAWGGRPPRSPPTSAAWAPSPCRLRWSGAPPPGCYRRRLRPCIAPSRRPHPDATTRRSDAEIHPPNTNEKRLLKITFLKFTHARCDLSEYDNFFSARLMIQYPVL